MSRTTEIEAIANSDLIDFAILVFVHVFSKGVGNPGLYPTQGGPGVPQSGQS